MNRLALVFAAALLFTSSVIPAAAAAPTAAAAPGWLEPNGLNIIDLVGYVPDTYLYNAIVSAAEGFGIIRYQSGSRNGDVVTLHTRVYPVMVDQGPGWQWSSFGCLGNPAQFDNWGLLAPAGRVRYYADGADVTAQVTLKSYVPAGQVQPVTNSAAMVYSRYATASPDSHLTMDNQGWGLLPANAGCDMLLAGRLTSNMTADFQFSVTPRVRVTVMGQQTGTFQTFIGRDSAGWLAGLEDQLVNAFGGRHGRIPLSVPSGADYVFVNAPVQSFDPYLGYPDDPGKRDLNRDTLPASGTYRLEGSALSVDHVMAMGLPLGGQWRDAGLSGGAAYLPYIPNPRTLAPPEYFLPPNIPYNPCMTPGTCDPALLNQIHDATMSLTVTYLKVERIATGLTRIPLRQVGPAWTPGAASSAQEPQTLPLTPRPGYSRAVYLPIVRTEALPPDDPTGCPCGWFDADGRMLDFIPAP